MTKNENIVILEQWRLYYRLNPSLPYTSIDYVENIMGKKKDEDLVSRFPV